MVNELQRQIEADKSARWEMVKHNPGKWKPRSEPQRRGWKQHESRELGEGYDQLPEPYLTYYRIAIRFAHKTLAGERDDLLHSSPMPPGKRR